jgi:hypothetical protein
MSFMENLELKKCKTCGFKGEISLFWKEVRKTCVSYNHCKECFLKKRRATDKRAYEKRSKEISAKKAAKSKIKRANEREIKKSTIEIICCIKCNDQFQKRKLSRTERKYFLLCEICKKFEKNIVNVIYEKNNKEKIKIRKKKSYLENIDYHRERKKVYHNKEENKIKNNKRRKEKRKENIEASRLKEKQIRDKNKARNNQKAREKRNNDFGLKLSGAIRANVRSGLKNLGISKTNKTFLALGYTIKELKEHLESLFEPWMNFNNHGKYYASNWDDNDSSTWTWQLDHIIPHSTFKFTSMEDEEFKKCWSLSNLRPLSAKQNILDGTSKIRHKKKEK